MSSVDLKDFSMLGLFLMEAENQAQSLSEGLLKIEKDPTNKSELESLMRAAHSLKGGARIIQSDAIVKFAHAMEDYFTAVINGRTTLVASHIDQLLKGVDLIKQISEAKEDGFAAFVAIVGEDLAALSQIYKNMIDGKAPVVSSSTPTPVPVPVPVPAPVPQPAAPMVAPSAGKKVETPVASREDAAEQPVARSYVAGKDNFVKVAEPKMKRLLELAGESFVHVKKLQSLSNEIMNIKRSFGQLVDATEKVHQALFDTRMADEYGPMFSEFRDSYNGLNQAVTELTGDFSGFILKMENYSDDFYSEVVSCKIMPFEDLSKVFPRMVRDLAQKLGKQVNFEVSGGKTGLDRDILEKLEAPLTHLLRNAIDHGLETTEDRLAAGKLPTGTVALSAFHWGGMFNITITDDGRGINTDKLRKLIVSKGLATEAMLEEMPEKELFDFLFLPGFTTKSEVSEISGRGVGLDVVMNMVQEVKGQINVETKLGEYTTFHLQLPITLSVIPALIVEIGNELYAFPSTRVDRLLMVDPAQIQTLENHQFISYDNKNIGVVSAGEVLGYPLKNLESQNVPLLLMSDRYNQYALVVDRFIRDEKIVVRPLDERLGKVSCINAVSVLEDGSPVLIVDVDDIVRSIDNHVKNDTLHRLKEGDKGETEIKRKKVLVVDDSITVRELEKQILENNGYQVETAVNGVDGWNAVRTDDFDIVITDLDMPRMNGFELVEKIKSNSRLKSLPVMIVSYKDREEDKIRGVECGADFYLTKSSFHDNTLIEAVYKLIGEAGA